MASDEVKDKESHITGNIDRSTQLSDALDLATETRLELATQPAGFLPHAAPFLNSLACARSIFQRFGWDVVSALSWFPYPSIAFFVADPVAVKVASRYHIEEMGVSEAPGGIQSFSIFGSNLVAAEGDLWKWHRNLHAPRTNKFVWQQTRGTLSVMFAEWEEQYNCENVVYLTRTFALRVISITAFWIHYDSVTGPGHRMSFGEAITITSKDGFLKLVVPEWAMCLTPRFRRARVAFGELRKYISRLNRIPQTKDPATREREDLFSALLRANETANEAGGHLNDEELFGENHYAPIALLYLNRRNIYLGFFAGHESTSVTLALILILLAQHLDEQERLYSRTTSVLTSRSAPNLYTHPAAVINETLRMYLPVSGFPKYCTEDTITSCASASSTEENVAISIPKGSIMMIDVPGLHYNAKYWKNPYKWDPSRHHTEWNKDAFMPFSVGSRACVGSFFETEATAMVTMLVAHYRVDLPLSVRCGDIELEPAITLCAYRWLIFLPDQRGCHLYFVAETTTCKLVHKVVRDIQLRTTANENIQVIAILHHDHVTQCHDPKVFFLQSFGGDYTVRKVGLLRMKFDKIVTKTQTGVGDERT
ncbi:cytochrome P450 [Suillus lakei]|nr:cytochrome P450 [Suillus lakei]